MLEAPTRSGTWVRCLTFLLLFTSSLFFSSCATEEKRTALINDPDAQKETSIPWNKPAKWENGANLPGGLGSASAAANGLPGAGPGY
ncbi:MAG TPA: hypothetical protein VGF73_00365 [Chthoniobacterales bacterium]